MNKKETRKALADVAQYRKDHFAVECVPSATPHDAPGEFVLRVTYNGAQWYPLSLTPTEARQVIKALQAQLREAQLRGD